ncbi:MAG: hypothetical protein R2818_01270 [Flavobacteriales bacterium]
MKAFWYEMHWGELGVDADGTRTCTPAGRGLSQIWYVVIYVISMAVLAFHLLHGFSSAFQSLGMNHPRYTPLIKNVGVFFGVVIPVFFCPYPGVDVHQSMSDAAHSLRTGCGLQLLNTSSNPQQCQHHSIRTHITYMR